MARKPRNETAQTSLGSVGNGEPTANPKLLEAAGVEEDDIAEGGISEDGNTIVTKAGGKYKLVEGEGDAKDKLVRLAGPVPPGMTEEARAAEEEAREKAENG